MDNIIYSHKAFDRKGILLFGDMEIDMKPFEERGLYPIKVDLSNYKEYINNSRGIIVADYPSKFKTIKDCFQNVFPEADNLGSLQVVFSTITDFDKVRAIKAAYSPNNRRNQIYLFDDLIQVAESLARFNPGPALMDVKVKIPKVSKMDPEIKILLQRSFFDCARIDAIPIIGGRDSDCLFKVHAWMKDSVVGPAPLPFFAKIAITEKIELEKNNYAKYTDLYIPFQYRPNCRLERCVTSQTRSSLVGNFIDGAISLRTSLEETHAEGIIYSLFEKSLKGFRLQPFVSIKKPQTKDLKKFVKERIQIDKLIDCKNVIEEAKALGLKSDLRILYEKLMKFCPDKAIMSPIHGDLHSGNVMVRGNDAILIDFSAVESYGPLTADPVTLEVSLCFNLGDKPLPGFKIWKKLIDEAYDPERIMKPLAIKENVTKLAWLRRAIREIRHILIGCDCDEKEIKVIMACYLMRIARLEPKNPISKKEKTEFKYHAYALVIAEKIINSFDGSK